MRTATVVVAVVLALGAGAAAGWSAGTAAGEDRPRPDGSGAREPFRDSGPEDDVVGVKVALPALLADRAELGRVEDPQERAEAAALVWHPDVLDRREGDLDAAVATEGLATTDWTTSEFAALEWRGVRVDGDEALAVVLGVQTYRWPDGVRARQPLQTEVGLRRDGDAWRLVEVSGFDLGDPCAAGPTCLRP